MGLKRAAEWLSAPKLGPRLLCTQAQFRENAPVVDERVKMVRAAHPVSPPSRRTRAMRCALRFLSRPIFVLTLRLLFRSVQTLLLKGEAMLAKHKHPDPYILSWRPGGTQYHRNPPPVPEVSSLRKLDPFSRSAPPACPYPMRGCAVYRCARSCRSRNSRV